ncbi:type I glyceraldehyde-3-phosphate dehydrogenase [Candidatus Micrarchaeota archaeon]|nr:type I glyceraldehyde-3-phosphate dehydrogenase [Candidatus Micrarchaeota archaeon]
MKVAITGFGRIGKMFLKAAVQQGALGRDFDVVAINTRSAVDMHVHMFKYDSNYGRFSGTVEARNGNFVLNDHEIKWIRENDPLKLPWKELGIDLVLESTGEFTKREDAEKHLASGAGRVLISAPAKVDATIVPGVNDHKFEPSMKVLSLASCTTNCLAPVLKVLHNKFHIEHGFLSTIHAYTNDQRIADASHDDWRRARAGAMNIIPTTTGAAKAIGDVIPELAGKMDGIAFRVPVSVGSINDVVCTVQKATTASEVNSELKRASQEELKGILSYTEEPLVSRDIVGTTYSSIVDGSLTRVIEKLVKVSSWYDNEFGYANRLVDFVRKLSKL